MINSMQFLFKETKSNHVSLGQGSHEKDKLQRKGITTKGKPHSLISAKLVHQGNLSWGQEAPGSRFQTNLALAIDAVWGMNQ